MVVVGDLKYNIMMGDFKSELGTCKLYLSFHKHDCNIFPNFWTSVNHTRVKNGAFFLEI